MERLTTDDYYLKSCIKCKDDDCGFCSAQIEAFNKLTEYEDLEAQGLLVRLPCKVGDTVWCIEEDDCSGMIFMSMCGDYVIVSSQYAHLKGAFDAQIKEMALESKENYGVETYIFHKDDVFLDKEEAEAKLNELEGE